MGFRFLVRANTWRDTWHHEGILNHPRHPLPHLRDMALFRIMLQTVAALTLAVVLLAPATEAGLRGLTNEKNAAVAPSPSSHNELENAAVAPIDHIDHIDLAMRTASTVATPPTTTVATPTIAPTTVATPPTCTASHVEALPACVNMLAEPAVAAQLTALDGKLGHVSSLTMPVAAITACQTALEREGGCELPHPACGSDMSAGVVSFKACAKALMGRKDHRGGQVLTVDPSPTNAPSATSNSNQDTDAGTDKDASITKDTTKARAMGHAVAVRGNEGDARTTALVLAATPPANKMPKTASTSTTKTPTSKTTSKKKVDCRCRAKLDEVVHKLRKARREALITANMGLGQKKTGGPVDDDSAKYGDKKEGNCANLRKKTPAEQKERCLKEAGDHCLKTCTSRGGASKMETKTETETAVKTAAETGSYKDHLTDAWQYILRDEYREQQHATKNRQAPKVPLKAAGTSGGTCWEAYVPKFASRCGGYTKAGYTCVNKHCAAMNPGGDPHICAKKMPEGSVVDQTTGRCVGPPPLAKVMTADEFLQRGDGSSSFTEGGAGNIGKESGREREGAPMDAARSAVSAWKAATRDTSKSPVVAKAVKVAMVAKAVKAVKAVTDKKDGTTSLPPLSLSVALA